MTEIRLFFVSGVLLILLPTLGVPSAWKERIAIGVGIVVCIAAYRSYRRHYFPMHRVSEPAPPPSVSDTSPLADNNATPQSHT